MTKWRTCRHCGTRFERQSLGRPALYCKRSCRQRAFERRRVRSRTGLRHQPTREYVKTTNDGVQTPSALARALVAALRPSGTILEPCAGDGAFVRALRPYGRVVWCENDPVRRYYNGRSFFDWTQRITWAISNPPWSEFRRVLAHSLQVADHVALLSTVNHIWTGHRRRLVRDAGFGLARVIEFDAPSTWTKTGFQLGMAVLVRGYVGPCSIETLDVAVRSARKKARSATRGARAPR